jgi:hypothetical protein
MASSRYEKYIVRKPGIRGKGGKAEYPDIVKPNSQADTGPLLFFPPELTGEVSSGAEYGIISGDIVVGASRPGTFGPHKHDFGELFLFIGTDSNNLNDLGATAEFWLGEGDEIEKIVLSTPSSVYVPAGLAHFPLAWKHVKRPCIFVVVACTSHEQMGKMNKPVSVSMKGRLI